MTGAPVSPPSASTHPTPPGPRGYPVVGILPRIWRDPLAFFREVARECGPVARMGLGSFTLYLLSGPEEIQYVLQDNATNYWKGAGLEVAAAVMGQGLATSEGETWQRQRRLMGPAFQPKGLLAHGPLLASTLEEVLAGWSAPAREGRALDVHAEMNRFALAAIFRTMFGADVARAEADGLGQAVMVANEHINHAAWSMIRVPARWPTPRNLRFQRALATLDGTVYGLIRERRRRAEPGQDLLGRLVAARDEATGEGMTDRQVRDEVMTQFVAGHETTSNALAWTLHLLATHPEVAERVAAEVGAGPIGLDDLERLDLVRRVVQESLRVLPPSWIIVRTPRQDDVVGGYFVPKDAPLLISQWVVHRDPALWPDPERFDPERWLPAAGRERPKYAYFPFGGGKRTCIGNHFALLLLQLTVARVCQGFRLRPEPGHPVVPQPLTTLRPRHGVRLLLEVRP